MTILDQLMLFVVGLSMLLVISVFTSIVIDGVWTTIISIKNYIRSKHDE